jgi:hypothetical protein
MTSSSVANPRRQTHSRLNVFVVGSDHAVLPGGVRMDELLLEIVGFEKPTVHPRGKDEAVVAAHNDARVPRGKTPKRLMQASLSAQTGSCARAFLLMQWPTTDRIGAVDHLVDVHQSVVLGPDAGKIGCPTLVGMRRDTRAHRHSRVAAFVKALMTLPALELHNPLHRLAIDEDSLATQRCPDHAIAR